MCDVACNNEGQTSAAAILDETRLALSSPSARSTDTGGLVEAQALA